MSGVITAPAHRVMRDGCHRSAPPIGDAVVHAFGGKATLVQRLHVMRRKCKTPTVVGVGVIVMQSGRALVDVLSGLFADFEEHSVGVANFFAANDFLVANHHKAVGIAVHGVIGEDGEFFGWQLHAIERAGGCRIQFVFT